MAFSHAVLWFVVGCYGGVRCCFPGVSLFLIGSAISAFAVSVSTLVLGRLVQAIGAGCGITLGRAIVKEVSMARKRLVKAIAYLTHGLFHTPWDHADSWWPF